MFRFSKQIQTKHQYILYIQITPVPKRGEHKFLIYYFENEQFGQFSWKS